MTHQIIELQLEGVMSSIKQIADMIQKKNDARNDALDIIHIKKEEIKAWDLEIIVLNTYMQESIEEAMVLKGLIK